MNWLVITVIIIVFIFVFSRQEGFQIEDNIALVNPPVYIDNNDNIKFQNERDSISYCKTIDCVDKENNNCNKFCTTIKPELTEKCTSVCDDITQRKLDHIEYQYKIFGSAYDFFRDFAV